MLTSILASKPVLLLDRDDLIIGVLGGRPSDVENRVPWDETCRCALTAMDESCSAIRWNGCMTLPRMSGSDGGNRRGPYFCVNDGPSHGGGQPVRVLDIFLMFKF